MIPHPPSNLVAGDGSASPWLGAGAAPVLDSILTAAGQLAPETHVGICVAEGTGTYTTLAGTDPLVFELDELQFDLHEGPSLTAMREGHAVSVDDAQAEHRWPTFITRAVEVGLRSHLGMPISVRNETVGALNMYSTAHTSVDAGRLVHARLFAAQAAIALGQTRRENDLVLALQSSRTIGKAIGLVMEQLDLDDDEAFAHLVRVSQASNMKLRDLAAHLIEQSNALRRVVKAREPLRHKHSPGPSLTTPLDVTDDWIFDVMNDTADGR